ncbi:MAG TPA: dockerin type I repeat-containing protein [Planctomycetota bacterium]|nr:dockerin type I repeat-containing protein [Planctomycetota bacterium]OQC20057.1 MAG: hypothetical protein BWX69_02213 [Planctomycetes bacterium ADurb.Bin069]NMD36846.1 hypothetical protein [Planctomycetota bacterium]HNR98690.1 dockerin type I repeat-containing protein [Planctomycetota bacterium]HNU25070.1 dockerin type I repeat-containing protein [Planctomycetota bacterium]
MKRHSRVVGAVYACVYASVAWAGIALRIADATAIPETPRLPIGVFATGPGEISAADIRISFQKTDLTFVEAALTAGVLKDGSARVSVADAGPASAAVSITIALGAPVALPATEVKLFDAVFRLGGGLVSGDVYPLAFTRPPRVTVSGQAVDAAAGDGSITVAAGNYFIMGNAWGYPGQSRIPVEFKVFNSDPLMGMQVSCRFDKDLLRLDEISQENTLTESLGCEFFQPVIDNDAGYFVLGILLDALAPANPEKRYPTSGYRLRVARLFFDVKDAAAEEQDAAIEFEDGLGSPPLNNRVVVDHESKVPHLLDGALRVGRVPRFIRGEVNGDGRIDIADPVMITLYLFLGRPIRCVKAADVDDDGKVRVNDVQYLLNYLFLGGRVIPPPFPTPGLDPTDDDLPCSG